jgi:tetratricopeptide (TPR) repeat protein
VLSALWGAWGIALVSGDLPQAEALALRMRQAADLHADPMLRLAHHIALGQIRWHQGRHAEAAALLATAVGIVDEHGDRVLLEVFLQHPAANSRAWLAIVLTLQGDVAAADALSADAAAIAAGLGHPYTTTYLDVLESWRAVWAGRVDDALRISAHGLALAQQHGFDQLTAFCLGSHGWALALSGRPEEAVPEVRLAIDAFESLPAGHMFGHLLHGVMAVALHRLGDDDGALEEVALAIAESERTGETFYLPEVHLVGAGAERRRGGESAAVERYLAAATALATAQGAGYFLRRTEEVRAALADEPRASVR